MKEKSHNSKANLARVLPSPSLRPISCWERTQAQNHRKKQPKWMCPLSLSTLWVSDLSSNEVKNVLCFD